jgi:hypothetical protein
MSGVRSGAEVAKPHKQSSRGVPGGPQPRRLSSSVMPALPPKAGIAKAARFYAARAGDVTATFALGWLAKL